LKPPTAPPADPLFSVLLHPDLAQLPPTYLVACGKDPTHDEILMSRDEMASRGCRVGLREYSGYPHFFFIVPMLKASGEYLDDIVAKIRELASLSQVIEQPS
jgi:versiconal hemiacetal acetate esterase